LGVLLTALATAARHSSVIARSDLRAIMVERWWCKRPVREISGGIMDSWNLYMLQVRITTFDPATQQIRG
jgi:hypothetical protein